MKIAVVSPSPVPFTIGGAENLMWGLCDSINKYTEHQADLIKLPTKERSFWDLIDSYYSFYKLDLSHFDLVITSKYPSWMVQHDNSICYMMHTLRGLYDTYHLMGQPEEVQRGCAPIDRLLDYMEQNVYAEALDVFFEMIYALKADNTVPESYYAFPGPLIRKVIHYMDSCALQQMGVKKYCSISDTVKKREDYFPQGVQVQTIYPPTTLKDCSCGDYKYVFMISRLDGPKRIDMLMKAMKYVKSDIELLIAGTGPERERLEEMAKGDKRIRFLGFVSDEEAENYYANSLVIPYFPYDEDYGYITIEAMLHKKPVITTVDAGGPTEFVENGENGFVVPFDEKEIAAKIDYLAENPKEAKRLGENGYKLVKEITWEKVVEELLDAATLQRKKVVVTSTFSIFPALGGGQARTYNLYKNLARTYDVEIVAFDGLDKKRESLRIASGMVETKVPKSMEQHNEEMKIEAKVQIPVTDIAMITLSHLTPDYEVELKRAIESADVVVLSHPYLYPAAKKYMGNKKFVYEAQDVEYLIKQDMLPDNETSKELLAQIYEVEKICCEKSEFIMTCSQEDKEKICALYGLDARKVIVVPNGVDCSATKYVPIDERLENKKALGLEEEKLGLFMGSWHQPNLEACEKIFEIAKKCPDVKFLLMGSQCMYFENNHISVPENVGLLGLVNEEEKNRIFAAVDFALNPMLSGSGTNLKMFDYMSAGIPIITTAFGTRGIEDKSIFTVAEVEKMHQAAEDFCLGECAAQIIAARKHVEEVFDWKKIAEILRERMSKIEL